MHRIHNCAPHSHLPHLPVSSRTWMPYGSVSLLVKLPTISATRAFIGATYTILNADRSKLPSSWRCRPNCGGENRWGFRWGFRVEAQGGAQACANDIEFPTHQIAVMAKAAVLLAVQAQLQGGTSRRGWGGKASGGHTGMSGVEVTQRFAVADEAAVLLTVQAKLQEGGRAEREVKLGAR